MATGNELIAAGKQLADQQDSNFVKPAVWQLWLQSAYNELYNLLVGRFEDYFVTTTSLDAVEDELTLPADFHKLRGVDRDGQSVRSFPFGERNRSDFQDEIAAFSGIRYCLLGTKIILRPSLNAPGTYRVWYVPQCPTITDFDAQIPGISPWEEYIHYTLAIKAMMKEETDASGLIAMRNDISARITELAANRDAAEPKRTTDVRQNDYRLTILGY